MNRKTGKAIAQAIAELGAFLSVRHINIENKDKVPDGWKRDLR
jgi:hypothetical protein